MESLQPAGKELRPRLETEVVPRDSDLASERIDRPRVSPLLSEVAIVPLRHEDFTKLTPTPGMPVLRGGERRGGFAMHS